MGKPFTPEEIELCREGLRLFREACLEKSIKRHERGKTPGLGARRDEGLTDAAEAMGLSRQAVSGWKDRIPFEQVYAAALYTGISPQRLHPRFRRPKANGKARKT